MILILSPSLSLCLLSLYVCLCASLSVCLPLSLCIHLSVESIWLWITLWLAEFREVILPF